MAQRPPRARRNRLDGPMVSQTFTLPRPLAEAVRAVSQDPEFRNNRSAVIERALVEFLNRRNDVRAA